MVQKLELGVELEPLISSAPDQETVAKLVVDGRADGASRFTYALGTLVLFTRDPRKFAPLSTGASICSEGLAAW